jgi:hypothetical protein
MTYRNGILLFLLGTFLAGCTMGQAVLVRRDQFGGVLALKGMRDSAMQDAQQQMNNHCHGPYQVVSEENVVVGEQTSARSNESYHRGSTYGSTHTTTTNVTEFRITYRCGSQGGPPPFAPPPPGPGGAPAPETAPPPPPPAP